MTVGPAKVSAAVHPAPDLSGLLAVLPRWSDAAPDLVAASTDRSGLVPGGLPRVVVHATSVDDVVATLTHATRLGVPVVTRGAGTGLAGGATAGAGSIVLDVSGLDEIVLIDPENLLAVVGPGVITADLETAAAAHGLRYAPDPASAAISTIGGNIATNAGGLRCVKYGVTRDAVLALDVVLGDGRRITTGHTTVKGVAGLDLTGLLVGSEGTLGVVVGATVRLIPAPRATGTASAFFATTARAAEAVTALLAAGLRPAVVEFLDHATLTVIDAAQGTSLRSRGGAFLLVQTDGAGAELELAEVAAVLATTAEHIETTTDPVAAEALLAVRRAALPSIETLGRVLIEDIAVPRSRLAEAVGAIEEISGRTGARIFTFAHAGDGNLHPIVVVDEQHPDRAEAAVGEIFDLALRLGGTLTGEHGIGVLKRPWLERELGKTSRALQLQLKAVFDPAGILNPGKGL